MMKPPELHTPEPSTSSSITIPAEINVRWIVILLVSWGTLCNTAVYVVSGVGNAAPLLVMLTLGFLAAGYLKATSRTATLTRHEFALQYNGVMWLSALTKKAVPTAQISHFSGHERSYKGVTRYDVQLHKSDGSRLAMIECPNTSALDALVDRLNLALERIPDAHRARASLHDPKHSTPQRLAITSDAPYRARADAEVRTLTFRAHKEGRRLLAIAGSIALGVLIVVTVGPILMNPKNGVILIGIFFPLVPLVLALSYHYKALWRTHVMISGQDITISRNMLIGPTWICYQGPIAGIQLHKGHTIDLLSSVTKEKIVTLSSSLNIEKMTLLEHYLQNGEQHRPLANLDDDVTRPMLPALSRRHDPALTRSGPAQQLPAHDEALHAVLSPAHTSHLRALCEMGSVVRFRNRAQVELNLANASPNHARQVELGHASILSLFAPLGGEPMQVAVPPHAPHTLVLTRDDALTQYITLLNSNYMIITSSPGGAHDHLHNRSGQHFHVHVQEVAHIEELAAIHAEQLALIIKERGARPVAIGDLETLTRVLSRHAYCKPLSEHLIDLGIGGAVLLLCAALAYLCGHYALA